MAKTSDIHVHSFTPLFPPRALKEELPLTESSAATVLSSRETISRILSGDDPRLLVIVGPCSIHDPTAAIEYAEKLNTLRKEVEEEVFVVMRVYFEKPRTALGWRGLILDPHLDGSYDIARGLRVARRILLDITGMGLPAGSEMLDPIVPQYVDDLVSWASIGARTTESQTHREMASGLSMPVGFKNGTDGSIEAAINGMISSLSPHSFIGIDQEGNTTVVSTTGNPDVHVILRGGRNGPNYKSSHVVLVESMLSGIGLPQNIVVDCSHGNSEKVFSRQAAVLRDVLQQRRGGSESIRGVMLESNLVEGRQELRESANTLVYGQSITDACISWETTEQLLRDVALELRAQKEPG